MSGSNFTPGNSNFPSAFDIEASVNQAWDAYNEKCKECQQLRDELELLKQRNQSSEHDNRIQGLREDVLRERAKQDDVVRKLEKTKMEADHLGKKETLAREELEKEREYQHSLMQIAEKKRKELEQKIENLEKQLIYEKNIQADILKIEKEKQKSIEVEFHEKEEEYVKKVRSLEEKVIALKEEVSMHQSIPLYTNGPSSQVNHLHVNSIESDSIVKALYAEMENLKAELTDLRTRAAEQNHILTALFENPRISSLTQLDSLGKNRSIESMQISSLGGANNSAPPNSPGQCNERVLIKRKKRNGPSGVNDVTTSMIQTPPKPSSSDVRQVIGSSMPTYSSFTPSTDLYTGTSYSQGNSQELGTPGNPAVFKMAEDFIRDISKDNRRSSKPGGQNGSFEYNPIFPPVDVSRVIHVPSSTPPHTIPSPVNPPHVYSPPYRNTNNISPKHHAVTDVQYSPYYNGNISVHLKGPSEALNLRNRQSASVLRPEHLGSKKASTPSSEAIVTSGGSSPQRSKNPFHRDMAAGDTLPTLSNSPPNSSRVIDSQLSHDFLRNLDMNEANLPGTDNPRPPRPTHLQPTYQTPRAESYTSPANPYISSDDENESGSFHTQHEGATSPQHQPKEFVVPRVVHASSLGNLGAKRTFQDSRDVARESESHMRPAMRAKTEVTSPDDAISSYDAMPCFFTASLPPCGL